MQKSIVSNKDDTVVNIIEWEEGSNWPVPEGYRLEAPEDFPYIAPIAEESVLNDKLIGEMTIAEFKVAQSLAASAVDIKSL